MDDYLAAGRIAGTVREMVRNKDWVGKSVYDLCEEVEGRIKSMGARCAFPVNASKNEIAAHYTAEPDDEILVGERDLVKIDLGAHVNGWIADTAVTINYDPEYDGLVNTAEQALSNALSMMKEGTKSSDIGRTIEKTVKQSGYTPILNLCGHSMEQYTIHAGKSIPNIWSIGSFSLSAKTAYACEPFVTMGKGLGIVKEGKTKNIFALVSRKRTKNPDADEMLDFIWDNFNMLPFALRWLVGRYEVAEARELLDFLVRKKAVKAYPILVDGNGYKVAQAEHTFIPNSTGITITTVG